MSRFTVIAFLALATLSKAFVPTLARLNARTDLRMMFDMFKKSSPANSIPTDKKVCVITGTTSGLGKETARALLNKGDYYVICACRDVARMEEVAQAEGFDRDRSKKFIS